MRLDCKIYRPNDQGDLTLAKTLTHDQVCKKFKMGVGYRYVWKICDKCQADFFSTKNCKSNFCPECRPKPGPRKRKK